MSDDTRVQWVAASIAAHCNSTHTSNIQTSLTSPENLSALTAFLDSSFTVLLATTYCSGASVNVSLDTSVSTVHEPGASKLAFVKTQPSALKASDITSSKVLVSALSSDARTSLFHVLHNVYMPMLTSVDQDISTELSSLLSQVSERLAQESTVTQEHGQFGDISTVTTAHDEVDFWNSQKDTSPAAAAIADALCPLKSSLNTLSTPTTTFPAASDETEVLYSILLAVWDAHSATTAPPTYPARRMRHLLYLLCGTIIQFVRSKLERATLTSSADGSLWSLKSLSDIAAAENDLGMATDLLRTWRDQHVAQLMRDWMPGPGCISRNTWSGGSFAAACLDGHISRFTTVQELLGLKRELLRALPAEQHPVVHDVFLPLAETDNFTASGATEAAWTAAKASVDHALEILDAQVSACLRARIVGELLPALQASQLHHDLGSRNSHEKGHLRSARRTAQPLQVMYELLGHKRALRRPAVAAAISKDVPALVAAMHDAATSAADRAMDSSTQFRSGQKHSKASGSVKVEHLASVLASVKQAALRVHTAEKAVAVFSSSDADQAVGDAIERIQGLRAQLKELEKEVLDRWLSAAKQHLEVVKGWQSARLLEADASDGGRLRVLFSSRLSQVVTSVRSVAALGYRIPRDLDSAVQVANKFYHYSISLQHIASFHNSFTDTMLTCHKPCLLEAAREFEAIALHPVDTQGNTLTWASGVALESFLSKLQVARQTLIDRNRLLCAKHAAISEQVAALARLDLIKQRNAWFSGVEGIRRIFVRAECEFPRELQTAWRLFWDQQLLKVLDAQFIRDLQTFFDNVPVQHVKLVYSDRQVALQPPLEDIRSNFYRNLLDPFLSIPSQVCGFAPAHEMKGSQFFKSVISRNATVIASAYTQAESLIFSNLKKLQQRFAPWVVLGAVPDLDDFVVSKSTSVKESEALLENLRGVLRDLPRAVPHEVREGCFAVDTVLFRAAVEAHAAAALAALGRAMHSSATRDRDSVLEFAHSSRDVLNSEAASLSELGEARVQAVNIIRKLPEMRQCLKILEEKNVLLTTMSKVAAATSAAMAAVPAPVDITEACSDWDGLVASLTAHEGHLDQQKEELSKQVRQRAVQVDAQVVALCDRWAEAKPDGAPKGGAETLFVALQELQAEAESLAKDAEQLARDAVAFEQPEPNFSQLASLKKEMHSTLQAWSVYGNFSKELSALLEQPWLEVRRQVHQVADFIASWSKEAEDMEKSPVKLTLLRDLDKIRKLNMHLPLLRGSAWEVQHWHKLLSMVGLSHRMRDNFSLKDLLGVASTIAVKSNAIRELDAQAQGEGTIRKALEELDMWGFQRKFTLTPSIDSSGHQVTLVKGWREANAEVSDQQSLVVSLQQSAHYSHFRDHIDGWVGRLSVLQEGLASMAVVQRKWAYLEPIFARGALPSHASQFRQVDDSFRGILAAIAVDPLLRAFAELPGISHKVATMLPQLDACQSALLEFLEAKRSLFPRFYFLGDDDLLEILGQPSNPDIIQCHLSKLFAGIHRVALKPVGKGGQADGATSSGTNELVSMVSVDGEEVAFHSAVAVTAVVEEWLAVACSGMRCALQALLPAALTGGTSLQAGSSEWASLPAQVLSLAQEVSFTQDAEEAILKGRLAALHQGISAGLANLSAIDLQGHQLAHHKASSLLLDLIHHRDVAAALVSAKTARPSEWTWMQQLRYYMKGQGTSVELSVNMVHASFQYTWEYQGNAPKLVRTPLTERCFLTLTQGMALGLGGNPYGPAGTGKTESVKALGQALGRQVLVFNCDEEFDCAAVGRIFSGLLRCGAWGCFDEFNRLDAAVLSAVSQQIQQIQSALRSRASTVTLLDTACSVDPNAGLFVTLNPAGKGYAGRSKLPDNLKALFRSVAMAAPDDVVIAEVLLLSQGFSAANSGAQALVALLDLSRQRLAPMKHYDWGLRSLKTILNVAGNLRRSSTPECDPQTENHPTRMEERVLVQAVVSSKLPALTSSDAGIFKEILRDVWPRVEIDDPTEPDLRTSIVTALENRGLVQDDGQVAKMMQLHACRQQRMGVILMGPSGSGKTTLWKTLAAAYMEMGQAPLIFSLNPKSMSRKHLLGYMDSDTREWTDGVLTVCVRKAARAPIEQQVWIVCDGDIDPEWIEALNSVLDDNRLLTMPNGERVQLTKNVNFFFECSSLQFASPATVSRCAVIYATDQSACIQTEDSSGHTTFIAERVALYIRSSQEFHGDAATWTQQTLPLVLEWLQAHPNATALHAPSCAAADAAADAIASHNWLSDVSQTAHAPTESQNQGSNGMAGAPVTALRAIAAMLRMTPQGRDAFISTAQQNGWCRPWPQSLLSAQSSEEPQRALTSVTESGTMISKLSDYDSPLEGVVMTEELRGALAIAAPWFKFSRAFVIVGPAGSGKRTLLNTAIAAMPGIQRADLACNSHTKSEHVVQKLVQVCGKAVTSGEGKVLKPQGCKRLLLVLHNLDLVCPDKYATAQLHEFVHQAIEHGGFYDSQLMFTALNNIQIIATAGDVASDASAVSLPPRLARLMRTIVTPPILKAESVLAPYAVAAAAAAAVSPTMAPRLAAAALSILHSFQSEFPSTSSAPHLKVSLSYACDLLKAIAFYDWGVDGSVSCLHEAFCNEAALLFSCRLSSEADRNSFSTIVSTVASTLTSTGSNSSGTSLHPDAMFSTLGASADERSKTIAQGGRLSKWPIAEFKELVCLLLVNFTLLMKVSHQRASFEREVKPLQNMFLNPETLSAIAHLDAALSRPSASVLLISRESGHRNNLVELVAHFRLLNIRSPACTATLDPAAASRSFQSFLRDCIHVAVVEGTAMVVLLEEHHLVNAHILQMVDSLLAMGEVPGLFSAEERDKLMLAMKENDAKSGASDHSVQSLPAAIAHTVKQKLQIILCLHPDSDQFSERLHSFPAMLSHTSVFWIEGCTSNHQTSLATASIEEHVSRSPTDSTQSANAACSIDISQMTRWLQDAHAIAAEYGVAAPSHFSALVKQTLHIIHIKEKEALHKIDFLHGGLSKLAEAETTVDELSSEAQKQREALTAKQTEVDESMEAIEAAMEAASCRRAEVEQLSAQQEEASQVAVQRKAQVEEELAEVQPLIDSAKAAVGSLKSDHLSEVRSLKAPPAAIRNVLEAVLRLMGQNDTSWNAMKRFLAASGVKDKIMGFDASEVSAATRAAVTSHIEEHHESFDPKRIVRVSVAAAPLAEWVQANLRYSEVVLRIKPLTAELNKLQESLAAGALRIEECTEELARLDNRKLDLQAELASRTEEAAELKIGLKAAESTLAAASNLLSKLSGEKRSWQQQADRLSQDLLTIAPSSVVAAAFVVYAAAVPENVRAELIQKWSSLDGMQLHDKFSLPQFLCTGPELTEWRAWGLPTDQLSIENAAVIHTGLQTPLLVDPNGTAGEWLTRYAAKVAKGGTADTTAMHAPRLSTAVELAVRFGKTLVITGADTIHPILVNVLRRDFTVRGSGCIVRIGDKSVDVDMDFRMILVSASAETTGVSPDEQPLLTIVNFTTTHAGLEAQLLSETLQHELPQLEEQRKSLLQQQGTMKAELDKLNRTLLERLAASQGDLLSDKALLKSLDETKASAMRTAEALESTGALQVCAHGTIAKGIHMDNKVSSAKQATLDEQCAAYTPVATAAASIFFALRDLVALSHMYRFSRSAYLKIFSQALSTSAPSSQEFLKILTARILRSTFERHRLAVAMHMLRFLTPLASNTSNQTVSQFNIASPEEWALLLTGANVLTASEPQSTATGTFLPTWVPEDAKQRVATLMKQTPDLARAAKLEDDAAWTAWMMESAPDQLPTVACSLTNFQQALLLQAVRPEQLVASMRRLASTELGVPTLAPQSLNFDEVVEEASASSPILFIVSAGGDPSYELRTHAAKVKGIAGYSEIALGQGQNQAAIEALQAAASTGAWLCIKNAHLATVWLPEFHRHINEVVTSAKPGFQLWMTSEPHDLFPAGLLRSCLTVAYEPPPGVKHNMRRSLATLSQAAATTPGEEMQLQVMLSWLHALVQERRRFVPHGWSRFHEFSTADLTAGRAILAQACNSPTSDKSGPPWALICGLVASAVYGGHIDTAADMRILNAYIARVLHPRVFSGSTPLPGTSCVLSSLGGAGGGTATAQGILTAARRLVDALPEVDTPVTFGLAANVDRAELEASALTTVAQMRSLAAQSTAGVSGQFGRAAGSWRAQISPLIRYWQDLLQSDHAVQESLQAVTSSVITQQVNSTQRISGQDAITAFLVAEQRTGSELMTSINSILSPIADAIGVRNSAITGGAMHKTLCGAPPRDIAENVAILMKGDLPTEWERLWEGPLEPLGFVQAAASRVNSLKHLLVKHTKERSLIGEVRASGGKMKDAVSISAFFSPGSFVSTLQQAGARIAGVPVDELTLLTCWSPDRLSLAAQQALTAGGVQLSGINLEGATFEGGTLSPAAAGAPPRSLTPPVSLVWVVQEIAKENVDSTLEGENVLSVPLYLRSDRRTPVLHLAMPVSNQTSEQDFIIAGASAFVSS